MDNLLNNLANDKNAQVFLAFSVMIALDMLIAIFFVIKANIFLKQAVKVTAKILGFETYTMQRGIFDRLTVEYKDTRDNLYSSTVSVPTKTHNNKDIEILYHPKQPAKAFRNNKATFYVLPAIMFGAVVSFGLVFIMLIINGVVTFPFNLIN